MKLLTGKGRASSSAVCCHQLSINEMTSKCIPTCSINPGCGAAARGSITPPLARVKHC